MASAAKSMKMSKAAKATKATTAAPAAPAVYAPATGQSTWDPLDCAHWDAQQPSPMLLKRVNRDVQQCMKNPPAGIFLQPDEDNVCVAHALVVGPFDTPYEGGLFYFVLRMPPDYPLKPPRVRLMTTGNDTVRFNPNLYQNGKVCLSILGTWQGPSWVASLSLESVLLSIQSLMSSSAYHNEPGYETEHRVGDSKRYNQVIQHETLRVAVCEMLEGTSTAAQKLPQPLKDVMKSTFENMYEQYIAGCDAMTKQGLQGCNMQDPFHEPRGKFDPAAIKKRLVELKKKMKF